MKALVKRSRTPGDVGLEEVPMPKVGPNRLLAKVAFAGICHSDFDIIDDKTTIYRPPVCSRP